MRFALEGCCKNCYRVMLVSTNLTEISTVSFSCGFTAHSFKSVAVVDLEYATSRVLCENLFSSLSDCGKRLDKIKQSSVP